MNNKHKSSILKVLKIEKIENLEQAVNRRQKQTIYGYLRCVIIYLKD
jgi:hypothetical protein